MIKRLIPLITLMLLQSCGDGSGSSDSNNNPVDRPDSAELLDIDLSGSLQNPCFSPDGNAILFTRFREGYNLGPSDLYIYDLLSEELHPLIVDGNSNVNLPGSSWNAHLNQIVFSSARDPHDEIFIIADTGSAGDEVQLTSRPDRQAWEPSFSPFGEWIVFESHPIDVEGEGIIFKYRVDGSSDYIQLTADSNNCKQPNWSPAGNKILYQQEQNGQWVIFTMDNNGDNVTQITALGESATDAVFSQDGLSIIYSSENQNVELANVYALNLDSGLRSALTTFSGYDGAPAISGSSLVFESSSDDPEQAGGTRLWQLLFEFTAD